MLHIYVVGDRSFHSSSRFVAPAKLGHWDPISWGVIDFVSAFGFCGESDLVLRLSPAAQAQRSSASICYFSASKSQFMSLESGAFLMRMVWRVHMLGGREWMVCMAIVRSSIRPAELLISLFTRWARFMSPVRKLHTDSYSLSFVLS